MWRSTRWSLPSGVALLAALLLAAPMAAGSELAQGLPPSVAAQLPEVKVRGGAELTFMGLSIYDARLFRDTRARGDVSIDEPFALQLVYRRRLYGKLMAERSLEEMSKLGYGTGEQRARWVALLKQMLPDVQDGDSITGINLPRRGVRFYKNGQSIGVVDDGDFARAFFAIWLDPRTSEPKLRSQLLGKAP
jgi:Chalcone isomerase-like